MVRRDFLGFLTHAADRYGDIFSIRPSPLSRIVVLNSATLAREVLLERPEEFSKSSQTRFMVGKFLGNGLVLSEGADHAMQRRTLQPSFGARALGAMAAPIQAETSRLTAAWEASTLVDVEPTMTALSMRIILRFLVGSEAEAAALEGEDGRAFRDFADAIGGRFRSMPLPAWIPTAGNRREAAAIRQVDRLVARLLEASARSPESRGILSSLASGIAKQELSFQQARDHIVTLLFAGHETVAKLMSWTLYLLARDPGAQEQVRADGEGLRYTSNVIREAMRLYPPVWVFDRSPVAASTSLGGFRIGRRDVIYISPYLLHRQARYFADPLTFDPHRFDRDGASADSGAFLAFGAGPRGCIGQALAMMEAKLVVSMIVRDYELRLEDQTEVKPLPGATLAPAAAIRLRAMRR